MCNERGQHRFSRLYGRASLLIKMIPSVTHRWKEIVTFCVASMALAGCNTEVESMENAVNRTTTVASPGVEWQVGLGTNTEEHVHEGIQTSDDGFIAIGHKSEQQEAPAGAATDILVIKTDTRGRQQWLTVLGTPNGHDVGYAIDEVADGYILGVGLYHAGAQRRAVIKLNKEGQEVWQKTYDGNGNAAVRAIGALSDGSILIAGYVNHSTSGFVFIADEGTGFLTKIDSDGAVLWDTAPADLPQVTKIREESDGNIALLSTVWREIAGKTVQNIAILRTTATGKETDRFLIGDQNHIQAFDFDLADAGGFIVAGHTTGYGSVNWDCAVARIGAGGTLQWLRVFGNPRGYTPRYIHDECYGVRQMPTGGFVVAGGSGDEYEEYSVSGHASGTSDEWKAYLIRVDELGSLLYQAVYGGTPGGGNNAAEFLAVARDGGVMLFNDTDSDGAPTPNNYGFMKLAPEK